MADGFGFYHIFETAAGYCGIGWNERAISKFQLAVPSWQTSERLMLKKLSRGESRTPTGDVEKVVKAARRYFDGEMTDFRGFPLDFGDQPEFFRLVYDELRNVAWGQTTTYGALAKALGAGPEAARDVGQAMAKNPIPLLIPCHRVLAAGGKIGGFSAPGGSASKARMLELEGVRPMPSRPAQASLQF